MKTLVSMNDGWVILLFVVAIALIIMGGTYLLYRFLNRNKKVEKPSDEQIAEENISRFVVDVIEESTDNEEKEEVIKEFEHIENEEGKDK